MEKSNIPWIAWYCHSDFCQLSGGKPENARKSKTSFIILVVIDYISVSVRTGGDK